MISVLYTIILITNFKLIEMCIKSSPLWGGSGWGFILFASPPFGGVGGGFTTSYAASSVHTLTVQPCVHQVGLLPQYICLLHQNNS